VVRAPIAPCNESQYDEKSEQPSVETKTYPRNQVGDVLRTEEAKGGFVQPKLNARFLPLSFELKNSRDGVEKLGTDGNSHRSDVDQQLTSDSKTLVDLAEE